MPTRLLMVMACLVLVMVLAGCGKTDAPGGANTPATVTTQVLRPSQWTDSIDAIGTAHANESVTITAKVSETVRGVNFESGDLVRTGQVLVTLSNATNVAGVDAAAANYRNAQQQFERQQGLIARQLVAASTLDTLRAARDATKAQLDQARTAVSDRVITAPFDGVLGLRQVSPGSLVTPGTVIATLDDVSLIKLDFSLPERALSALSKGQAVIARSEAYPDQAFDGTIASLDSRVDPVTRAITVQARLANPERKLRPGMLLDVAVQRPARQTLQVPELALQQVGQQPFLFRVGADDKVEQVPVRIGARRPGFVEIVDGVKAGERVVVEGTIKLHPGSKVVEAGATSDDSSARATKSPKQG